MKTLKIFLLIVLLFFAALIGVTTRFYTHDLPLSSSRVTFTIPLGTSLQEAAQRMETAGVEMPAWQLSWFGRALGRAKSIKAGSYEIERGITAIELIDKLTRGEVLMAEVLLVEGKTFAQWRTVLNEHPDLSHDSARLTNAEVLQKIGAPEKNPEGIFSPDTYLVDKGSSDLDVLRRARAAMLKNLDAAWSARDSSVKLTDAYAMLTLASIVEKETGLPADRPQIASVFANRLRIGMPLQSDPTVIYGMGAKFDGNLRRLDLMTDSPWNTYTRTGLPLTPIAMPGLASLQAVSRPPASDYLYFVARGDGSSEFSTSLDEHNKAVSKFQKGGK